MNTIWGFSGWRGGAHRGGGSAQFGAKTILVEKAKKLGGDCLHFGCVPSKTLIRTAGVWSLARRAKEFGLPEVALPPVSLAAVMARVRSVIDTIQEHDSPGAVLQARRRGPVRGAAFRRRPHGCRGRRSSDREGVDHRNRFEPFLPPVEGITDVPYWTNETVFSQTQLPDTC